MQVVNPNIGCIDSVQPNLLRELRIRLCQIVPSCEFIPPSLVMILVLQELGSVHMALSRLPSAYGAA